MSSKSNLGIFAPGFRFMIIPILYRVRPVSFAIDLLLTLLHSNSIMLF